MDMVDIVRRGDDDDDDGDAEADVIDVDDAMDVEVAADKSATVGDEVVDVTVDEVATAAGPEVTGSGSRKTPPVLMLRWTLTNVMSIPLCRLEKTERGAKA
jgi:hypothetical protein